MGNDFFFFNGSLSGKRTEAAVFIKPSNASTPGQAQWTPSEYRRLVVVQSLFSRCWVWVLICSSEYFKNGLCKLWTKKHPSSLFLENWKASAHRPLPMLHEPGSFLTTASHMAETQEGKAKVTCLGEQKLGRFSAASPQHYQKEEARAGERPSLELNRREKRLSDCWASAGCAGSSRGPDHHPGWGGLPGMWLLLSHLFCLQRNPSPIFISNSNLKSLAHQVDLLQSLLWSVLSSLSEINRRVCCVFPEVCHHSVHNFLNFPMIFGYKLGRFKFIAAQ